MARQPDLQGCIAFLLIKGNTVFAEKWKRTKALLWLPCDALETFDLDGDRIAMSEYIRVYQAQRRQQTAPHGNGESVPEALQLGDRVIWWKRIPGGDYVYPVQSTVLALTGKRVKIKADDEGKIVMRYVPAQSLQRQG